MTVENIILSHSNRGMNLLRPYLPNDFCRVAAESLYKMKCGNILLTTGFYVSGFAETDGPPGTLFIAKALNSIGFNSVIITDKFCNGFFEFEGIETEYIDINADTDFYESLLNKYKPKALLALERCGINANGEYTNMYGGNISQFTAKIDQIFELGRARSIPSYGIGDGGNEIGMGCFKEVISQKLSIIPCVISVDYPIIASVSNWGGYGLCAYLQMFSGKKLLPNYNEISSYLQKITNMGCIDSISKQHIPIVDGFSADIEREIIESINEIVAVM